MERNTGTSSAETATQLMKAFGVYSVRPDLGGVLKRINATKAYEKAMLESKIFLSAGLGVPFNDEFVVLGAENDGPRITWEEIDE